jgi:hypothetical protein
MYSHDEILEAVDSILMEALEEAVNRIEKMNLIPPNDLRLISIKKFLKDHMWEFIRRINRPAFEGGKLRPDIWFFGGALVIEVKVYESEFGEGYSKLKDYVKEYFKNITVKAIITNGLRWNFYNVITENDNVKFTPPTPFKVDEVLFSKSIEKAVKESLDLWNRIVRTFEDIILKTQAYAYTPEPENIRRAFYPLLFYVNDLTKVIKERLAKNGSAIYYSYADIMRKLYTKLTNEEIAKLLATHTIIQVIVNAILSTVLKVEGEDVEVCSGEVFGDFDITLPHLIWWKGIPEAETIIADLCREARNYTYLFNWNSQLSIDVFSHLYEDFIERSLRYKIGEYYTPWWLIELIIERLKALKTDIANSIILDPSCGSGRFLVAFFYKKVEEGIKPDQAYYSLIGIDINPLAVSIGRAELIIAYKNKVGRNPKGTPLIFWGDSLAPFVGATFEIVNELDKIKGALTIIYQNVLLNWMRSHKGENENKIIILTISRIEALLTYILKSLRAGREVDMIITELEEMRKKAGEDSSGIAYDVVIELLKNRSEELVKFLSKYGNGVWAIPLTSSLVVGAFYSYLNPDIIATNPPWLELNELPKSKWGIAIRNYIKRRYPDLPPQVYQKGDLSVVFLDIALQMIKKNKHVGFVLPADQCYSGAVSSYGVGKILTLKSLEKNKCLGEIIYVGDAFGHGQHASIVCLEKR